ncbi:MAG: heavy metal translocating P-type ATPase [Spirochaetaceae bacterium]|nr:heavy metal translocating P-type ATPase [Spirochaetaceae bacterium]
MSARTTDDSCAYCSIDSTEQPGSPNHAGEERSFLGLSLNAEQIAEARLLIGAVLGTALGIVLEEGIIPFSGARPAGLVILAVVYAIAAWPVLRGAVRNLLKGSVLDELFLMSIASLGAIALGAWEEAASVMVFYRIGEFLQEYAVHRSRRSIEALIALRPAKVRVRRGDQWQELAPEEVQPGDRVFLRAGERLGVDGQVMEGQGSFDTSALTGEALPRTAEPGQMALAGWVLREGALILEAARTYQDSTLARIMRLVETAQERKARTELFIARFARVYTPVVVALAAAVAIIPPLVMPGATFSTWVYRALVLLVISCPCAFVLSVPLTYFAGLGGAARRGILIKGAAVLDSLVHLKTIAFDKTGTLTSGSFKVTALEPKDPHTADDLLAYAAAATVHSNHPLSRAIQEHWHVQGGKPIAYDEGSFHEIPGHGSSVTRHGTEIIAGNDRLLHLKEIPHTCTSADTTLVHVAIAGELAGSVHLEDQLKHEAPEVVHALKQRGVQTIALFTGDSEQPATRAAASAGIETVYHSQLPEDKLRTLEQLMQQEPRGGVAFVGDGINDGPVLARSDVGIAMGQRGSDLALEQAEVVLMTDDLRRIPEAIDRARATRRIVWQNILGALGVKVAVLVLGALGQASMWEGVLADAGVALLAVLNALRAFR